MRSLTSLLLTLPLALSSPAPNPAPNPQAPYPIAQSSFGPVQASLINSNIQAYLATVTAAAAYTAAASEFATVSDIDLVHNYRGDPVQLALDYYTATATPTWFSELPAPLQTYIENLGGAQAAIESSDAALTTLSEPANTASGATVATTTSKAGAQALGAGNVDGVGMMVAAALAGAVGVGLL